MRDIKKQLVALEASTFRARFRLTQADCDYIGRKSRATIRAHAHEFLVKRLAPAQPDRDGKQTPMKGHPVFVAQHATATCCRNCLAKWHGIEKGRPLSTAELDYIEQVIDCWLGQKLAQFPTRQDPQRRLFACDD